MSPRIRNECLETTLAEKIASLLEGEVMAKENMAHKTMQIMSQKDMELAGLNEKIRLLELISKQGRTIDSLDGQPIFGDFDFEGLKSGRCSPACIDDLSSDPEEEKEDVKKKQIKSVGITTTNSPNEDLRSLHLLNAKLLSAIYNDTQTRKDEQINFMKIIKQLSDVVKELKDQNNIKNVIKQSNKKVLEQQQNRKTSSPKASHPNTVAERECDGSAIPLKDIQHSLTDWDQIFNTERSTDSHPNSAHTSNDYYYRNSEDGDKLIKEKYQAFSKKLRNKVNNNFSKILRDKFRNMSLKLRKQEKCLAKTRMLLKKFQDQEKSLMKMVEDLKNDKEREKSIIESLVIKSDKMIKNDEWDQIQLTTIKELKDRISKIEHRVSDNNQLTNQDTQMCNLLEELKQINLLKKEYQDKNTQLNTEVSECLMKLALNKKQIEELKDTIRKEKALNESMRQAYEINVTNVVSNAAQEQRHLTEEIKMSFENNIAALQVENSELKAKICRLEEESKKICNDSKIRVVKAKKQLYSQVSVASQKLLRADSKIKEFYNTIEKMMKCIYQRLYEAELEHIKRKCQEEGGVQAASYILGVSATQMSRVLAAEAIPSLHDWIECCRRLVYREKFAEDLAGFILSLFWPVLPKDIAKVSGAGDCQQS